MNIPIENRAVLPSFDSPIIPIVSKDTLTIVIFDDSKFKKILSTIFGYFEISSKGFE